MVYADRRLDNPELSALIMLQRLLLQAAKQWSQGADLDARVEAARHQAILINHARYVKCISAYQRLAEGQGLLTGVEPNTIINHLMFPDEIFKSYDPQWLQTGDFARMTDWLGTLFFRSPQVDLNGVKDVHGWREQLKADEVFLTYSSGTSGRLSFVPRDRMTLQAMSRNGAAYTHSVWAVDADGRYPDFACLVLSPRGKGMGIQSAGVGLAQMASRSHFLFDAELTADITWRLSADTEAVDETDATQRFLRATRQATETAYARSFDFIRQAAADQKPILIFGAPFQVKDLCAQIAADGGSLPTRPGSIVITGGGWKSFGSQKMPQALLHQQIETGLGIARSHIIDTYSTAELNCVFMSCTADRYHIPPLIEPVVLDETFMGAAGVEGFGTLGFLDPFAISYPGFVITGDQGQLVRNRCDCGLSGWAIAGEIERAPDQQVKGCGGVMSAIKA